MERVFAFTDESGAFGWDFQKQGVSTHFVISAIIVKESDLDKLREDVEGGVNRCLQLLQNSK